MQSTFIKNAKLILVPAFLTAMCGTITYPLMVRLARSKYLFKLRNFYAIHLSIAPFLALIHINIFSGIHTYMKIKQKEQDFDDFISNNP